MTPAAGAAFSRPVTALPGVGPALAEKLARLGIRRVGDLLFHLPARYEDRTRVQPIGALVPGERASVEGVIEQSSVVFRGRRMLVAALADGTGVLTLRFFRFSRHQQAALARGQRVRCFGEPRRVGGALEMAHPEFRVLRDDEAGEEADRLTPVYPATEGLPQQRLRGLVARAVDLLDDDPVAELVPLPLLEPLGLPPLEAALRTVHGPPPDAARDRLAARRDPSQRRLAFEELLAHHLSLRRLRVATRAEAAPALAGDGELMRRFLAGLPFALTGAQQRALAEIEGDLRAASPMMRLLQGDVGAGKTVVAAAAAVHAAAAGAQAAVMAPTELLAEQHLASFTAWFEPLGQEVVWLSGRLRPGARRAALGRIAAGAPLVVGTHALFQDEVAFDDLALVIIDEQHRFGVHQRLALRQKGAAGECVPHQLVMTATPIPRTLAMTAYADLDCSVLDEKPPGRKPVKTVALPENRRGEIVQRVRRWAASGRQVYWVCPLIAESEALECQAAEETAAALAEALPELEVGLVHGRMKGGERDDVMGRFKDGQVQLLVATTVIEVGVDVPNASLMIIENAERMGLAQLHQLRGRVGRGEAESSCVLMYRPPLSEAARERLGVLRRTDDGFEVARRDLEMRGAGELLGTRQTGLMQMRVADVVGDADLVPSVQRVAAALLEDHAECVPPLIGRWIGAGSRYGKV